MPTTTTTASRVQTLVDADLDRLVVRWAKEATSAEKSKEGRDSSWLSIAEHVLKNKVTKEQLKRSLVRKGGLSEKSVGVEVSRLIKFQKDATARGLLQKKLGGDKDITMSMLRAVSGKRKGSDEIDRTDDDRLIRKLMLAIKFAQKTFSGFDEPSEFVPYLEEAFRKVSESKTASAAGTNGEEATKEEQLAEA